jgi:hypothetical protein
MDVSEIVAAYGNYYINSGQNKKRLYNLIYQQQETAKLFSKAITKDTVYRLSSAQMTSVLQAFQIPFTEKGELTFKPEPIQLFKVKMDTRFAPDEISDTWLGFWEDLSEADRYKWPIVRWYIEEHLMPQLHEDLEEASFKGEYVTPTPGSAGNTLAAMDGLKIIQDRHVASGRTTPIVTGAMDTDPKIFVAQIEDFMKQLPEKYRHKPMELTMSKDLAQRYADGVKELYQKGVDSDPKARYNIFGFPTKVKGVASHAGSNRIWCTPKGNGKYVKRRANEMKYPKPYGDDRYVKTMSDFWLGYGYILPELLFMNDQA